MNDNNATPSIQNPNDILDRTAATISKYGPTDVLLAVILIVLAVFGWLHYDATKAERDNHRETIANMRSDKKDAMEHGERAINKITDSMSGVQQDLREGNRTNSQHLQQLIEANREMLNLHRRQMGLVPNKNGADSP